MGCPWPHTEVSDEYNQACTASAEWWEGLKVQQILVTAGEEEVLVDGIKGFVETLSELSFFILLGVGWEEGQRLTIGRERVRGR